MTHQAMLEELHHDERAQEHAEGMKDIKVGFSVMEGRKVIVTKKHMVPEIRCSRRFQQQLLKKDVVQCGAAMKKRSLKGTSLTSQNIFAALDNELIVTLASKMGVDISDMNFDSIHIIKDLEVARHVMDRIKVKDIPYPNIEEKIGTVGRFLC
jgi:hypothetical protein